MARLLCNARELASAVDAPAGAVWKLTEPARQLDANVVHLPAGATVGMHTEPDLDVLLVVVAGSGTLDSPGGSQPLSEGSVIWLPHGSTRSLRAAADGLYYLTVHRRRPGMTIPTGAPSNPTSDSDSDSGPGSTR